jgi:hypothetical protein
MLLDLRHKINNDLKSASIANCVKLLLYQLIWEMRRDYGLLKSRWHLIAEKIHLEPQNRRFADLLRDTHPRNEYLHANFLSGTVWRNG